MTSDPSTTDVLKTLTGINASHGSRRRNRANKSYCGPFLAKYFSRALAWTSATSTLVTGVKIPPSLYAYCTSPNFPAHDLNFQNGIVCHIGSTDRTKGARNCQTPTNLVT
jgi:hypothetical protein